MAEERVSAQDAAAKRHSKSKKISEKTAVLRESHELVVWLSRKLCREDVFPKRSRWLLAGKIADTLNDYMRDVVRANEIKVITQAERDARHYWQTMAMAELMTLDVLVNNAVEILDIEPERLKRYAGLCNSCRGLLMAWMNADNKRYGPPTGLEHIEQGSGR